MSGDSNSNSGAPDSEKLHQHSEAGEIGHVAEVALKKGISEVDSDRKAEKTLDALETAASELNQTEAAAASHDLDLNQKAQAIASSEAHALPEEKTAAVIQETAAQVAGATERERETFDQIVAEVTGGAASHSNARSEDLQLQRGRRLLRKALMRRLRPLDALDAILFLQINRLPHPPAVDRVVLSLTNIMHRGDGWLLLLLLLTLRDRRRGIQALRGVAPALWLATGTVEFPIKHFFRRKRPFTSIVRAIIVGRKPGSFSFPSGHSAAAFAGLALLLRFYPEHRALFRTIATLVGFSRIYLGAHYPGDVVTGAITGFALARFYRRLLRGVAEAFRP